MKRNICTYAAVIVLSVAAFLFIYGFNVLNPFYDAWLLQGGDLTQHYIGWEFFRCSNWTFPLGLMDKICYPNEVSVIFTDSIPLLAIFFKLFSPLLPQNFQYFGWWELICFILQGILSFKLLAVLTGNKAASIVGSLLFLFTPAFLARVFFHTALSAQWLLLAALYFSLLYIKTKISITKSMLMWGLLGSLCASIHIYYIPMCGIIMSGFLLQRLISDYQESSMKIPTSDTPPSLKRILFPLRRAVLTPILIGGSYTGAALAVVLLLGGLSHDHQLDAGGLGQFSFNMNGFINPMGWSQILPDLSSYGEGSGDGFAYLGLGVILLLILALSCLLIQFYKKEKLRIFNCSAYAYGFIILVCILVSASHKFAWNGTYVINLPYPDFLISLWGMFRSSGRFIWPVIYLFMLGAVTAAITLLKPKCLVIPFLLIVLFIQIYDIFPVLSAKQAEYYTTHSYTDKLLSDEWNRIAKGKKHILFVSHLTDNQDILYSLSQYAYLHDLTINDFYLAHSAAAGNISESREEGMKILRKDTIYIFKIQDEELRNQYALNYYLIDDIVVGLL